MKKIGLVAAAALLAIFQAGLGRTEGSVKKSGAKDLVGTWALLSHSDLEDGAQGRLLYLPNGTMAVIITGTYKGANPAKPALVAYAGRYSVKDDLVLHHVEVSDLPGRVGVDQVRRFEVKGNVLTLSADDGFQARWQR